MTGRALRLPVIFDGSPKQDIPRKEITTAHNQNHCQRNDLHTASLLNLFYTPLCK